MSPTVWPYMVFSLATILTVPLYLLILLAILRRPKLTPFHVLSMSQGVADIFFLFIYNFAVVLRVSRLCDNIFWENRYLITNVTFATVYYTLYLRCIGITLISVQRYITLCLVGTRIEMMMLETPSLVLVMLHWLSALPITAPLLTSFDITIDSKSNMEVLVPPGQLALANMIAMVSVVILFIICSFCYIFVINRILRSRFAANIRKRHEIRLSIQFAGLMVAFLFVFIYSIGQYFLNHTRQITLLYGWRQLSPLMNIFLSCVHPWMCLFFNEDIRNRLLVIIKFRQNEVNATSTFQPATSAMSRK